MLNLKNKKERSPMMAWLTLLKKTIGESLAKTVIQIKYEKEKIFFSYFKNVITKMDNIDNLIKNIGKLQPIADSITVFKKDVVSSLNSLPNKTYNVTVKNSEELNIAMKEFTERIAEYFTTVNKALETQEKSIQFKTLSNELKNVTTAVKAIKLTTPASQKVEVSNPQKIDMGPVTKALDEVKKSIQNIRIIFPSQKEIKIPAFPDNISVTGIATLIEEVKAIQKNIEELPGEMPHVQFPDTISVDNFPIQKYPVPPTRISINPLRGAVQSTRVDVTTTATQLPTDTLTYRRAMIIFNNSAQTVYLGGSDVTVSNGLPIGAGVYSPPIDAGPRMQIYAIVSSSTADVRLLEVSDADYGGSV